MKAIIPVAGKGSRLAPYGLIRQKCLLPVAGRPILEHILNRLTDAGVTDITLIIGHLGEQVQEFCRTYKKANFNFVEQKEQLGLGHAIYQGLKHSHEPVVIVLGDSILDLNYKKLLSSTNSTIGVDYVPDPQRFGIVELVDNQIVNVVEKPTNPRSNLALIGIYYISSQKKLVEGLEYLMNNDIRTKKEYQLTDAFSIMIKRGHIFESLKIDTCMDCGVPESMLSTNLKLLEMENNNAIHSSVIIEDSDIYHCTISENCIVKDSNLKNVIMLEGSKVFNSSLEDQIIGFKECVDGSQS